MSTFYSPVLNIFEPYCFLFLKLKNFFVRRVAKINEERSLRITAVEQIVAVLKFT